MPDQDFLVYCVERLREALIDIIDDQWCGCRSAECKKCHAYEEIEQVLSYTDMDRERQHSTERGAYVLDFPSGMCLGFLINNVDKTLKEEPPLPIETDGMDTNEILITFMNVMDGLIMRGYECGDLRVFTSKDDVLVEMGIPRSMILDDE